MSGVTTYAFEVIPANWETGEPFRFEPFLIDIPTAERSDDDHDRCARRAWWSVFHMLGPQGIEPEDFVVLEWDQELTGDPRRVVGSGGFVN
jgi:hypothetical protein